mgnify:CR=1 FL=1
MPTNGLIANIYSQRFYASSSISPSHTGIGTGFFTHGIICNTLFTPNPSDLNLGFSLAVGGSIVGDAWSVTYTGPGALSGQTWTGMGYMSMSAYVQIDNFKAYDQGADGSYSCTISIWINGILQTDIGISGLIAHVGTYIKIPSGTTFLSIPWGAVSAGVNAATYELPDPLPDTYDYCSEATGTHILSYSFKEKASDEWTFLPVVFDDNLPPGSAGDCTNPGYGTLSVVEGSVILGSYEKDCHAREFHSDGEITECITTCICPGGPVIHSVIQDPPIPWELYTRTIEQNNKTALARLFPNLEKGIVKMNTDYGALIIRDKFPKVEGVSSYSCDDNGISSSSTNYLEVYPEMSELLAKVTDETHVLEEDAFDVDTYSPKYLGGTYSKTVIYELEGASLVVCSEEDCPVEPPEDFIIECESVYVGGPGDIETETYTSSVNYTFPQTVSNDMPAYLLHDEVLPKYVNSGWCHPHNSVFLYTDNWDLDGGPIDWVDYHEKVGSQHIKHISLPSEENTLNKNHIISDPLATGNQNTFCDTYISGLRFLGISRFQVESVTPLSSFEYDASTEDLWSVDDGTLSAEFAHIEINGMSGPIEVSLSLKSFSEEPYFYPQICSHIELFDGENIDSVTVYLEGEDGSRVKVVSSLLGKHVFNKGSSTKYAGSWAQDYGSGETTDQGTDETLDGMSNTIMNDVLTNNTFSLLPGFTRKNLIFKIEPTDIVEPVKINYPTITYENGNSKKLVYENAHQSAIIHSNGQGIRFGNWQWYDESFQNPPVNPADGNYRPTVVDGLCYSYLVLKGENTSFLTTRLTQLYDTYEGQSIGGTAGGSNSFILSFKTGKWNFALVNSFSEYPPLFIFPRRSRDNDYNEVGDYIQKCYSWYQNNHYFITSGNVPLHLYDGSIHSVEVASVLGWKITSSDIQVDGSETGFKLRKLTTDYAEVRPFRGTFSVIDVDEETGKVVYRVSKAMQHFRAFIKGGTVWVGRTDNALSPWIDTDTGIPGDSVDLDVRNGSRQKCFLWVIHAGDLTVYESPEGETLIMPTSIATGDITQVCGRVSFNNVNYVYYVKGTSPYDLVGKIFDSEWNELESEFTILSSIDDKCPTVDVSWKNGKLRVVLLVVESGNIVQYVSDNGITFI